VGAYNREREAGMSYENTHSWVMGGKLTAVEMQQISDSLDHPGMFLRLPKDCEEEIIPNAKIYSHAEANRLTAAQMNQLSETIHGINAAIDKTVLSLTSLAEAMHVCPNCGTTKHHKGFRPWEECDGCGAEWRTG
jgi:hypothetical protein